MGFRGPVPNWEKDNRSNAHRETTEKVTAPGATDVPIPAADPDWHFITREWYESLAESGQHVFYEPSDWAMARFLAEVMSRTLKAERMNANLISAILSGMTDLLVSAGSRRRMRIELDKSVDEDASNEVTPLESYRKQLGL